MANRRAQLIALSGLCAATLAGSVCSPAPEPSSGGPKAALISEIKPTVSVKELMEHLLEPAADYVFDSVSWDSTAKGLVEHRPTTDQDWERIETGAITIAEGVELLKVPRPWTPSGDVNDSLGPNPPELSPLQIQAKLDKDPVLWVAKIQALRNVALEVLDIVKKRDANALWEAGGDLDQACESCHLEYWYFGTPAADSAKAPR